MPLEQIRPAIQLYRSDKTADNHRRSLLHFDYDDEDHEEKAIEREEPLRLSRPENMNLLKLGGVGGVTRSGSWGRNQTASRDAFDKRLTESPEEEESSRLDVVEGEGEEDSHLVSGKSVRAQSTGSHQENQRKGVIDHFRSCSSDVPSSSSRTSTSSYSAAAFSLRSVSNRDSISSTTSSGASSSRSPTAASEDESTATNASNRVSQVISSGTVTDLATSDKEVWPLTLEGKTPRSEESLERLGPGVSRIRSIGRGAVDSTQADNKEEGDENEDEGENEDERERTVMLAAEQKEEQATVPSQDLQMKSSLLLDPPRPPASQSNLLSQQMNALTLSAAAASPFYTSSSASTSNFVPPVPRRHTGAFALRSQSALSQSGGAYGVFSGGGGGRAAARELARNTTTSYDNAPFSELEARRAMTQSSPKRPSYMTAASQPSTPMFSRYTPNPGTSIPISNKGSSRTIGSHDRTMTDQSNTSPSSSSTPQGYLASSTVWPNKEDQYSVLPSVSPPLNQEERLSKAPRTLPSPIDLEAASAIMPATPSSASSSLTRISGLGISTEIGTKSARPSLTHSASGNLTTTNVLRTPTTEEWSRFLAKQGLDPAVVAANSVGRVRTSTGRSATSQRRHATDRIAGLSLTPSNVSDFATAARQNERANTKNVEVVSDDEEDDSDEEELMESLRQLGLSRGVAGKSSSPHTGADDFNMLREDYGDDDEEEEEEQGSDGGEGGDDSSSDERMQALHEAISRPPSRHGSPPPLMATSPAETGDTNFHGQSETTIKRIQRPSREMAATVMGYPLPPPGERRKIEDFVVVSDIGRGAYGLVKKVQLKDEVTGKGCGKEFCIKYIIKSRILADCWRRHKMLGPIPIEIHVMDQLRRLSYKPRSQSPPWSVEQLLNLKLGKQQQPLDDSLGHPSLCKMLDFFEDREFYYMVMPCFGAGQDLFDHVESQPHGLSSMQVRCIFGQIADGLRFLHQNNIVHRDVKDENVILDGRGHVQIIDFGSAAHVNKNGRLFDTFSGTLDYAAAEILKGEKYGGKEQDVWALGVVGYVLVCGDCPFWNGEEAIQGLRIDSRAYHVLQDRCRPLSLEDEGIEGGMVLEEEVEKRTSDLLGQMDGGGKIEDVVDLIESCLELDISLRPSMELICQHRFLIGKGGWYGHAGWRGDWSATKNTSTESLRE